MELTTQEGQTPERENPLSIVVSTVKDLLSPDGSIFRASRQGREDRIAQELELVCFTDENINFSLAKPSEKKAQTAQFDKATTELKRTLDRKIEKYGEAHIETAKTLLILARLHYHRENRVSHYGQLEPDACLNQGNIYMDRFVAIVRTGALEREFFTLFPEPTETENLIGDSFGRIARHCSDENVIRLTTALALREKAAGQRLESWRLGTKETLEEASYLLDSISSTLSSDEYGDSLGVESGVAELQAIIDLERMDDLLTCLSRETEHWLSVEEDANTPSPWRHRGEEEANRRLSEYRDKKSKVLSLTEELSTKVTTTLTRRADVFRSELFALEMLNAIGEFCAQRAPEAYERVYKAINDLDAPTEYERALGKHFERYTTNLADRSRDRIQGESLLLGAELLANLGYAENSSKRMGRIENLGHFYRRESGYSERFIYPRFGGGDPNTPIDYEPIMAARACYAKAQEIAAALGKDFDRRRFRDEITTIDKIVDSLKQAIAAPDSLHSGKLPEEE